MATFNSIGEKPTFAALRAVAGKARELPKRFLVSWHEVTSQSC